MEKNILLKIKKLLFVFLFIILTGCSQSETLEDTAPYAFKINDTIYITRCEIVRENTDQIIVLGTISGVDPSSQYPVENDHANFEDMLDQEYGKFNDQIVGYFNNQWNIFYTEEEYQKIVDPS